MRDLHCHLLYGVDDGSKSIEQTKELLRQAYESGITDIMFTPHYISDSRFVSNKANNLEIIKPIIKFAKEQYNINVFLGNEVFITEEMMSLYKNREISTLNDSRYMLFEIPMCNKLNNLKSIIFDLTSNGIVPILAHPERYVSYYKDFDFFYDLKNMGVLLQINYASLLGAYGTKAKKMAKKLLKLNLIDFVGSDIHTPHDDKYINAQKAMRIIKKLVDEDVFIAITENNFAKVIYDEEI